VKTIHSIGVGRQGRHIILDVHANAFLHHMVRNIAGVLMAVGQGTRGPDWVREVLDARDRRASGITAPAGGLYLVGVDYDPVFGLPASSPGAVGPIVATGEAGTRWTTPRT